MSELCVQSSSVSVGLGFSQLDVCCERLWRSQVSERVTSLSDVASTDIESSDTATESAEW